MKHSNPSMQEFQNIQALRVINSFAKGLAKGNHRDFDGNYMEVNKQKENKLLVPYHIARNIGDL